MPILEEAAQLVKKIVKKTLGREYEKLTMEGFIAGIFFTGVKLSNGRGGFCIWQYPPLELFNLGEIK